MHQIAHPDRTYIKALQFRSGQAFPETFDVWNQFAWDAGQNSVYLAVVLSDNALDN